jgi:ribosome recycling factor
MAALQRSEDFSAQPQRDPDNDLELVLKVEVGRPEEMEKRIKALCNRWKERIREVTAKREKVIKGWQKENVVTKDVFRKLESEIRGLQTKELAAVEGVEKKELLGMQQRV